MNRSFTPLLETCLAGSAIAQRRQVFEPAYEPAGASVLHAEAQRHAGALITEYLRRCADDVRAAFHAAEEPSAPQPADVTEAILGILLHQDFNHQSRGRVSHLLPDVRRRIAVHVARGTPIELFMSYNGGYRAATRADLTEPLGFTASTAEFLLFSMIARFRRRLLPVYPPGMIYHIVLNNSVAHYVNDIPIECTEGYAQELRGMIVAIGGARDVRVLVQSSLGDFACRMRSEETPPAPAIDPAMHRNIERFLGRPCSEAEARMRLGRYAPAEGAWWQELREIIATADGVRLLQVASPDFLSFRPFPGGAARAQVGQLGFRVEGEKVVPALITTRTAETHDVLPAPVRWPLAGAQADG